ncbi:MAG: hypothetical protein QM756_13860 [Polyangiaceae bacterium]
MRRKISKTLRCGADTTLRRRERPAARLRNFGYPEPLDEAQRERSALFEGHPLENPERCFDGILGVRRPNRRHWFREVVGVEERQPATAPAFSDPVNGCSDGDAAQPRWKRCGISQLVERLERSDEGGLHHIGQLRPGADDSRDAALHHLDVDVEELGGGRLLARAQAPNEIRELACLDGWRRFMNRGTLRSGQERIHSTDKGRFLVPRTVHQNALARMFSHALDARFGRAIWCAWRGVPECRAKTFCCGFDS